MTDWTDEDLRLLAAQLVLQEGTWIGNGEDDGGLGGGANTITSLARVTFGEEGWPELTREQIATVRTHIKNAKVVIDGKQFDNIEEGP